MDDVAVLPALAFAVLGCKRGGGVVEVVSFHGTEQEAKAAMVEARVLGGWGSLSWHPVVYSE